MDDPTEKNKIVFGEAEIPNTGSMQAAPQLPSVSVPAMESKTQIIPVQSTRKYCTLEDLMESWGHPLDMRAQCEAMFKSYIPDEESSRKCVEFMAYVAENDFSKERFPNMALHLPAMFSLPVLNQKEIMTVLRKNLEAGDYFSAYKIVLETHEEAVRARVYSRLDQLGLHQEILDHQYIWENLNAAFFQYPFLQNSFNEDQDESRELMRRLDFLEQIVPHYLEMAELVSSHLAREKPTEANAIARRIATEYNTFYVEKNLEEVFERVERYTLKELEKERKNVRERRDEDERAPERPPASEEGDVSDALRAELAEKEKEIDSLQNLLNNSEQIKEELFQEKRTLMQTYKNHVSGEVHTAVLDAVKRQASDSAEEINTLRTQYEGYIPPKVHRIALESETRALKAQYAELISREQKKVNDWLATKKQTVLEKTKESAAPSGTGRWKLAAALGALGVSLVAGGLLYFSEARQNKELTQLVDVLGTGNKVCIEANNSLYKEGKQLAGNVAFYEKNDSCLQLSNALERNDKNKVKEITLKSIAPLKEELELTARLNDWDGISSDTSSNFIDNICSLYVSQSDYQEKQQKMQQQFSKLFDVPIDNCSMSIHLEQGYKQPCFYFLCNDSSEHHVDTCPSD